MNRSIVPPRRLLVTVASLAAAILLVRLGFLEPIVGSIIDGAVRNIVSLILGFSALVSLLLWFLRESGHDLRLKRAVGFGLLGAVGLALAVFRIERVSGDLVPELMFRWSPSRDRLLPRAGATTDPGAPREAWTETPEDFPRFLGPDGTASLDRPRLDPDWTARPPQLAWRRPIGAGWGGFAICDGHAVTLEQRGEEEVLACYDLGGGEPEWQVAVTARHQTVLGGTGPRSTPTIRDGIVFATGATGWVHAVDGATGRVLWRKNVLDDLGIDAAAHAAAVAWGRAGSPLVTDDLVIVPGGGPLTGPPSPTKASGTAPDAARPTDGAAVALVAYDRATGARRWTAGDSQISYVTPRLMDVAGRMVVVTVNEAAVAAYDPADGATVWSFPWPGHSNSDASCSQPRLVDDRRLLLSKGYGVGAVLFEAEPATPANVAPTFRPLWSRPNQLKTKITNVVVHDGHAYGLSDGIHECVSVADGTRAWKGGRYGQGQVLRVGPLLVVQAEAGEVVLVDCMPGQHRVRGRIAALDGQTWNNPALSGNRLLVRNAEEAACWKVPLIEDPGAARVPPAPADGARIVASPSSAADRRKDR